VKVVVVMMGAVVMVKNVVMMGAVVRIAKNMTKKILMTGGGTAGSVTPLLGVVDKLKYDKEIVFTWIGTKDGVERLMVERENIPYFAIASGRLRRYWTWQNFTDIFRIKLGFWQALILLKKIKPDLVMSAGGFVSVPVAWAAYFLRIPVLIHQQDVRAGLANKLMAPCSKVVTVVFEKSLQDYGKKAILVGNYVREELRRPLRRDWAIEKLGLRLDMPVTLVMGGGTGALAVNEILDGGLKEMTKVCQVVHITGKGKNLLDESRQINNYKPFEFVNIEGMIKLYRVADVIVSRCGMNALTELSFLGKASILIPMPDSHQEDNAQVFAEKNAAVVLDQKKLNSAKLASEIINLIKNKEERRRLQEAIKGVIKVDEGGELIEVIKKLI